MSRKRPPNPPQPPTPPLQETLLLEFSIQNDTPPGASDSHFHRPPPEQKKNESKISETSTKFWKLEHFERERVSKHNISLSWFS